MAKKDENEKLQVQIRTTELGTPTLTLVQDYAQVSLEPSEINVSDDASVPTTVTFPSPIYLQPNQSFAVVLLAPTTNNYWHGLQEWVKQLLTLKVYLTLKV